MNDKPVSYLQTDPRWKSKDYSASGETTTIGASGCGPTSMAMVLATWADKAVTPETECAWALRNGWKCPHSGTYYGYFVPAGRRYGLTVRRVNTANIYGNGKHAAHAEAKAALDAGHLVIACMGRGNWTSSGHYVLCWQVSGSRIFINDPASTRESRIRGDYALFRTQVKYYWIVERPTTAKEESDMTEKEVRAIVEEVQNTFEQKVKSLTDANAALKAQVEALENAEISGRSIVKALTNEQAYTITEKADYHARTIPEPEWSRNEGHWKVATDSGVVDGTRPEGYVKRDEVVAILSRQISA